MQTGIDIVFIKRFEKHLNDIKFMQCIFTDYEIEYIQSKANKVQTMAGIFACKEAVLKALGVGLYNGIEFKECSIVHDANNKPYVELNDKLLEYFKKLNVSQIKVSISHDNEYAISICNLI